jgi:hypothetical protein
MTSSQIMINTQIVIATAAARFSSARAALGQSDRSATSSYGDLLAAQGNVTGIPYAGINSEGKLICHTTNQFVASRLLAPESSALVGPLNI